MGEGFNFRQLKERILAMSQATDWEVARKEWGLVGIHDVDEPETCLCGHFPINEICHIHNRVTGQSTDVGNQCVKRFLGLRSDLIFTAIKRVRRDPTKALNADAVAYFYERGLLSSWEYGFLQNTMRKRTLSAAQLETRLRINEKVMLAVKTGFTETSLARRLLAAGFDEVKTQTSKSVDFCAMATHGFCPHNEQLEQLLTL